MRRLIFLCLVPALAGPLCSLDFAQQGAAASDGCRTYLTVQPLDANVMKLLATPIVPPRPNEFSISSIHQLEEWDLPSKVTPWKERPSAQDLAQRWSELDKKFNPAGDPGVARPYGLHTLGANDRQELEKWFAKEGPKRVPGACVGPAKATYVIAVGAISDWSSGRAPVNPNSESDYSRSASATRQDSSIGANAATYSPTAHENSPNDLPEVRPGSNSSGHSCVFLFRANGPGTQATPEYYYCKSGSAMSKAAVTTMLKYLAKSGQL